MKKILLSLTAALLSLTAVADDFDTNKPFGFCTVSSRTDAAQTYEITGGGIYDYSQYDNFTGSKVVLKSSGQDMKGTIQNAIKQNDVVILDGSDGDFIVSENIGFERGNKTILGINNARLCTQWYVTDEIKSALDAADVLHKSTSSGSGGTLSNGKSVSEARELATRQAIINVTSDNSENYRKAGIFSLNKENVIIRNLTFVGPGAVDVGGNDLVSATSAKHCWIDHCTFQDGMDGNFDITSQSDFNTVSWCIFRYTSRSYDHRNTNLVGSSDDSSSDSGKLNTTFAFNWWSTGCNQRMPMARYGKIHMLNNYFSCTGASNCINPRKNSEFLIEGNYFTSGVSSFYGQSDATAVTWGSDNYHASKNLPSSTGSTVTVPYSYSVTAYASVPDMIQNGAGATLAWANGTGGGETTGTKGSISWPLNSNTDASVATTISESITSTSVTPGSNLTLRAQGTYNNIRFSLYQAQTIQTSADASNAVIFAFTTKTGYQFKASEVELYACKVGTNNGTINISWEDAGGTKSLWEGVSPNRNNVENGYFSYYNKDISSMSTATEGTCSLIVNMYNVGAMSGEELQKKDIGLAQVLVRGTITDTASGISTPVTISTPAVDVYYNLRGQRVDSNYKGLVIKNGKKYIQQ